MDPAVPSFGNNQGRLYLLYSNVLTALPLPINIEIGIINMHFLMHKPSNRQQFHILTKTSVPNHSESVLQATSAYTPLQSRKGQIHKSIIKKVSCNY